jgi:hypothetical protein
MIDEFAKALGVSEHFITGRSLHREAAGSRLAVYYVLRESGLSYPAIAKMMKKNSSSIITGVRSFGALLEIKDKEALRVYNLIKHIRVKNMSEKQQILVINPPDYRQEEGSFRFTDFNCVVCSGRGHFTQVQTGYDQYEQKECDFCGGSGKLEALVTVRWVPETLKTK